MQSSWVRLALGDFVVLFIRDLSVIAIKWAAPAPYEKVKTPCGIHNS